MITCSTCIFYRTLHTRVRYHDVKIILKRTIRQIQKTRGIEKLIDWRNIGNRLSGDSPILVATIRPPIRPRASTIKKSVSWFFSKWFAADSPAIPAPMITILHLTLSSSVFFVDSAMIISYQLSVVELTWLINFYSNFHSSFSLDHHTLWLLLLYQTPCVLEIRSKFFDVSHFYLDRASRIAANTRNSYLVTFVYSLAGFSRAAIQTIHRVVHLTLELRLMFVAKKLKCNVQE